MITNRQTKKLVVVLCSVVLSGASLLGVVARAQTHGHEAGAATAHKLKLNAGKKWATDEPLRKGMGEIRELIAAQEQAIHGGKLKAADYAALGTKIDTQVAYMVQNCKLEPEADANLHLILEDLIAGSDAMQGKNKKASRRSGVNKVVAGLSSYSKYFDHPGWRDLK